MSSKYKPLPKQKITLEELGCAVTGENPLLRNLHKFAPALFVCAMVDYMGSTLMGALKK